MHLFVVHAPLEEPGVLLPRLLLNCMVATSLQAAISASGQDPTEDANEEGR